MDDETRASGAPRKDDPPPAPDPAATEPEAVSQWEDQGGAVGEPAAESVPRSAQPEPEPDYKDRWLRAEAELQNFRRRAARDSEEGRRLAEEGVLFELVAVLDDLERALSAADPSLMEASWTQGVALVAQRIREYLARVGVTVEDPLGQAFDPAFHDALLEVDAPEGAAPGTVLQVVQKGYRRGARALRAARVVVARAAAGSAT